MPTLEKSWGLYGAVLDGMDLALEHLPLRKDSGRPGSGLLACWGLAETSPCCLVPFVTVLRAHLLPPRCRLLADVQRLPGTGSMAPESPPSHLFIYLFFFGLYLVVSGLQLALYSGITWRVLGIIRNVGGVKSTSAVCKASACLSCWALTVMFQLG